jgi:gamma-glutamyl-gamma-aminobutyrate hydrolase PuuD
MVRTTLADGPLVVVTASDPTAQADPSLALRKSALYLAAVARHGGRPVLLPATASATEREAAFATMDGLLLSGGTDIHPARYGRPIEGSRDIEPDRDELEAAAWAAAESRGLPVLGICRGLQAINVFAGGTLLQDVADHPGPGYGSGPPARMHPIRIDPATRFGRALADRPATLEVNTYHHQAVTPADLAPSLVASAWADSPAGEIVEALEAPGERFVVGVQCHPERTEYTPAEFEGLWAAFVTACRDGRAVRPSG